jgi:hypothetical protein
MVSWSAESRYVGSHRRRPEGNASPHRKSPASPRGARDDTIASTVQRALQRLRRKLTTHRAPRASGRGCLGNSRAAGLTSVPGCLPKLPSRWAGSCDSQEPTWHAGRSRVELVRAFDEAPVERREAHAMHNSKGAAEISGAQRLGNSGRLNDTVTRNLHGHGDSVASPIRVTPSARLKVLSHIRKSILHHSCLNGLDAVLLRILRSCRVGHVCCGCRIRRSRPSVADGIGSAGHKRR